MAKVIIKSISGVDRWETFYESVEVYVDEELIGEGSYGGEPEDNVRYRDYSWVEPLLEELAKRLGADVVVEQSESSTEVP